MFIAHTDKEQNEAAQREYAIDQAMIDNYDSAFKGIEGFIGTKPSVFFITKLEKALDEEEQWALYLSEEIGLEEKELAALKNDRKEMEYILSYEGSLSDEDI